MTISFNQIPANRKVPFVYVEFDNKKAIQGSGTMPWKALVIGQKTSAGTQAVETPVNLTSADQALEKFGAGSQLHKMMEAFFNNNQSTEVVAVALADAAGAAASGSFVISGPATESGTLYAYIGGEQIALGVTDGDASTAIATALGAAINAEVGLPVIATVSSSTVNVIAKNKGTAGNEIDLRTNYNSGEEYPSGVGVTVNALASGATDPDIQDAIDAIGSEQYNLIVHPYNDATNLGKLEDELLDRWGPLVQNDGVAITGKRDVYADMITLGDSRNSHLSIVADINNVPEQPCQVAAAIAGQVAVSAQIDPARPFQTLQLKGIHAPSIGQRRTDLERNNLLLSGIATIVPSPGGVVRIERLRTTYKQNANGADDESYADLETVLTLSYLRWSLRTRILTRYPRHKLANDGTRYGAGQAIVTPLVVRSEIVLLFKEWEFQGLVEGFDQFKNDLIVERNVNDVNRLDVLLPPDLVNQLRVVGAQIQFLL